jgi:hypothetical protein
MSWNSGVAKVNRKRYTASSSQTTTRAWRIFSSTATREPRFGHYLVHYGYSSILYLKTLEVTLPNSLRYSKLADSMPYPTFES